MERGIRPVKIVRQNENNVSRRFGSSRRRHYEQQEQAKFIFQGIVRLRWFRPHGALTLSYPLHFQSRTESKTIRQFGPPLKVNLGPNLFFSLMMVTASCLYVLL